MNSRLEDMVGLVRKDTDSRNRVIERLYLDANISKAIYSFVMKNGGNENEANDLFTYAIMAFIKQCYRPYFELNNTVEAYIFSIAKYQWVKIYKGKKPMVEQIEEYVEEGLPSIEEKIMADERVLELKRAMKKLDDKCREVLTLWSSNLKMREISVKMAYKSEGMARKKKHECLGKLKLLIKDV